MQPAKIIASLKIEHPLLPKPVVVEIMDLEVLVDPAKSVPEVAAVLKAKLEQGSRLTWTLGGVRTIPVPSISAVLVDAVPIIENRQPREG